MWAVIGSALSLLVLIIQEYLKAKDREKIEKEEFDRTQLEFAVIAQKALIAWQNRAAAASQASQSGQDWLDQGKKPGPK